jgi:nucleotide-binding universal stress UspA family protein
MHKRYEHILVPLDGSEAAEAALADAFALAERDQADVTLLHVILPIQDVITATSSHRIFLDEQWETRRGQTRGYLRAVCRRVGCAAMTIHIAVEMGPAAETIVAYARQHSVDLIVMVAHGRSGLSGPVCGSVADQVLRGTDLPILLVRVPSHQLTV